MASLSTVALVSLLALHFGAVITAWATRIAAGSRAEGILQTLFLMTMASVGVCAWYCHSHDLGLQIPSGLTLTAMALTAVTDFRRTHEPVHSTSLSMQS